MENIAICNQCLIITRKCYKTETQLVSQLEHLYRAKDIRSESLKPLLLNEQMSLESWDSNWQWWVAKYYRTWTESYMNRVIAGDLDW